VKKYQNNNITNHALLACMWVGLRRVLRLIALHLLCQQAAGCLSGFRICISLFGRSVTKQTNMDDSTDRQTDNMRVAGFIGYYW
jgi:hypothetical protein